MKPGTGERVAQVLLAFLKAVCYLALFLGMQVAVMLPVILAAWMQTWAGVPDAADSANALLEGNIMAFSLISGILTLMVVLVFYRIRRMRPSEALWLRRTPAPALWVGTALMPSLFLAVNMVLLALPAEWVDRYNTASSDLDSGGFVGVLAVVIVAPVVEEIIFRGLIMTRLSRAMPGWLAILLSAAVFGACHGDPVWFGYAFPMGVVLGLMDWKAGSIWPSILGHVTFNAIGQTFSLLPETESGVLESTALAALLIFAIAGLIVERKAIAALFRPAPKPIRVQEFPLSPGVYEFDPWDE